MSHDTVRIAAVLDALSRSRFRARFHLKKKDRDYVRSKSMAVIRGHAVDFITSRVAPAEPDNDGRQTPMRNHPVFIAQHATATCCRGCLAKWHHIPKGVALDEETIGRIVDIIMAWITSEMERTIDVTGEDT